MTCHKVRRSYFALVRLLSTHSFGAFILDFDLFLELSDDVVDGVGVQPLLHLELDAGLDNHLDVASGQFFVYVEIYNPV